MDYSEIAKAATVGSPLLLNAVGRLYGLGADERESLFGSGIPTWTWATAALIAGFVVGVRVYKAYPSKVPGIIKGK